MGNILYHKSIYQVLDVRHQTLCYPNLKTGFDKWRGVKVVLINGQMQDGLVANLLMQKYLLFSKKVISLHLLAIVLVEVVADLLGSAEHVEEL